MSDTLQTLVTAYHMAIDNQNNPWGDFNRVIELKARWLRPNEDMPTKGNSVYFKVCKHTGQLQPITEKQFKDICVAAALANAEHQQQEFTK